MAEETKVRLYKIASELNIGKDEIIEYLTKVGKPAKNHMAILTEEQMDAISSHFKKDKEVADKHKKKVETFRASRVKKKEPEKETVAETKKKATSSKTVKKEEPVLVEEPVVEEIAEVATEEEVAPVEEIAAETAVETEVAPQPEVPAAPVPQAPAEEDGKPRKHKKKAGAEEKVIGVRPTLPGLKIMGKMDLGTVSKKEGEAGEAAKKKKKKIREEAHKVSIKTVTTESTERPKKKKRIKGYSITDADVAASVRKTLAEMDESGPVSQRSSFKRGKAQKRAEAEERAAEVREREKTILHVTEYLTVAELANFMNVEVPEVISKCTALGMMVSINQRLDKDTIVLIADDFGFQVEFQSEYADEALEDTEDPPETLKPRAPVVTIMGHVDHGKTSLLDYIRSANVVAGESGGITQHIGAYSVTLDSGKVITFLDTPGHEAFTAMRARGAVLTDIVVLVVAADDAVMPQTIEAIAHAQAANVPIIVAMNKIDKPDAAPDRIRQQLADHNILVEEWGGKYQCVELSARTGKNVPDLLSKILLEAEVLDLKANPDRDARGAVVEAELDKGKGIVATVLVQKGTLRIGDTFVCGTTWGRVRALSNERGQRVEVAHMSTPIQVLGFDTMPQAGDVFVVVPVESEARAIANRRQQLRREQEFMQRQRAFSLDEFSRRVQEHGVKSLPLVVKGDVDGSVEALSDSLLKLSTDEVRVVVLHRGVGEISEGDVLLASASQAIIVGFHVRPNLKARKLAEQEGVDIRLYSIIYECINEVKQAMEGMLAPDVSESIIGTAEVRDVFRVPKVGSIAGCMVVDGKIVRNNKVRVIRDGIEVFKGGLASLRRFKDDVREVETGYECGISVENFQDIKVGDMIESYTLVESKRKL
ncbi:MAG TPA: translation initiation factor IF-2 [Candidatus Kapabacteria bacterium]|nr:translation initiation factor IF-2 [Candidatus Kapabacteria bacterium]